MWKKLLAYSFPNEERRDPRFKEELDRLSVVGLRVIAGVCIGAPLFVLAGLIWAPDMQRVFRIEGAVAVVVLGVATLALSFCPPVRRFARGLGILTGFLVFVIQILSEISVAESIFLASGNIIMIMLVGIASLPIKPHQAFGLGLSMSAVYAVFVMQRSYSAPAVLEQLPVLVVMVAQVILLCSALTAVVYHQRVKAYRARRSAEDAFEELKNAQSRLLITENAASQGRLAAALSHELNSPIGALSSAIDTLFSAYDKLEMQLEGMSRLKDVIVDATNAARQSSERLKRTVDRLKHLTNLDRAEEQLVDLNALWSSSVNLLQGELDPKANVLLELRPLPRLRCKPQQMSAVFSNLLRNSANSMDRKGTIHVTSERRGSEVVLEVRDDGRGIAHERLSHLFDPSFRVEGQRVSTTNWGLFISRSIIAEHGGQIEIESTEGRGTTARISLPVEATSA